MSSRIGRATSIATTMLALVAGLAFGQAAPADNVEQQLRSASQQMLQSAQQGDKQAFGAFLADDLSWVGPNGRVMDKQETVGGALPPPLRVDVQQVLPQGQTATVVAIVHMKDGSERHVLQEWVNRNGKWQVLAHESAPMGGESTPAAGTSGRSAAISPSALKTVAPTLSSSAERAVWQAQTDIVEAYGQGDITRYSKLTADPFTRIETNGQLYDRSQWLEHVAKNREHPLKPGAISDARVKLDDNDKLASVTMQVVPFNPDGSPGTPERQTRIFALSDGQWKQVAAVSTPISQQ